MALSAGQTERASPEACNRRHGSPTVRPRRQMQRIKMNLNEHWAWHISCDMSTCAAATHTRRGNVPSRRTTPSCTFKTQSSQPAVVAHRLFNESCRVHETSRFSRVVRACVRLLARPHNTSCVSGRVPLGDFVNDSAANHRADGHGEQARKRSWLRTRLYLSRTLDTRPFAHPRSDAGPHRASGDGPLCAGSVPEAVLPCVPPARALHRASFSTQRRT